MKTKCPCPNTSCRRHGNCVECREFHRRTHSATYCDKIKEPEVAGLSNVNLMDYAACAG